MVSIIIKQLQNTMSLLINVWGMSKSNRMYFKHFLNTDCTPCFAITDFRGKARIRTTGPPDTRLVEHNWGRSFLCRNARRERGKRAIGTGVRASPPKLRRPRYSLPALRPRTQKGPSPLCSPPSVLSGALSGVLPMCFCPRPISQCPWRSKAK